MLPLFFLRLQQLFFYDVLVTLLSVTVAYAPVAAVILGPIADLDTVGTVFSQLLPLFLASAIFPSD